jgi:hypothetical protein
MAQDKKEEKKTLKELLDDLDMARNDAALEIYKVQALLKLCLESEFHDKISPEEPVDWLSIFTIIEGIMSTTENKLNEIDSLTTLSRWKVEELVLPRGAK